MYQKHRRYILQIPDDKGEGKLKYFDSKKDVLLFLMDVKRKYTKKKLMMNEIKYYSEGDVYNPDEDLMKQSLDRQKERKNRSGCFFAKVFLKNGKKISRRLPFESDVEDFLSLFKKEIVSEIILLNERHSLPAEWLLESNIL